MTFDNDMDQYLRDIDVPIRLACLSTSNFPVVVSLWYVYDDKKLYCATQSKAKITKYLTHSQKCGFEIAGDRFPYYGISVDNICPQCGANNSELTSFPIMPNESFTFDYNSKHEVELEFRPRPKHP